MFTSGSIWLDFQSVSFIFLQPRYDKSRIERSVAEKPLNDDNSDSSSEKSSKDKQGIEGLKLTIKASRLSHNVVDSKSIDIKTQLLNYFTFL